MSKEINIRMSYNEIAQRIGQVIKPEHRKLMAQALMEICHDNDSDLEMIFKASMGITPHLNYFVGQQVIVDMSGVPEWRFNKEKMIEEGMIIDGKYIEVEILHTKPFNNNRPYTVQFDYICKDDGKKKHGTSDMYKSYIKGITEEFPGE